MVLVTTISCLKNDCIEDKEIYLDDGIECVYIDESGSRCSGP